MVEKGSLAPDFTLLADDGTEVSLSDLRGAARLAAPTYHRDGVTPPVHRVAPADTRPADGGCAAFRPQLGGGAAGVPLDLLPRLSDDISLPEIGGYTFQ